jgi:tRNA 2-thiouridine synthesizing protein A
MATVEIDVRGARRPVPVLKMTHLVLKKEVNPGDTLVVVADCPAFEEDVREWCRKLDKILLVFRDEGIDAKRCEVRI